MRIFYTLLVELVRPIAFAAVLWRGLRNRAYWEGLGERFGFGAASGGPTIWLHAVSLGEVTAAATLVRALHERHPHIPVVVTTATPTGRARARALFGARATVRYLPYDTPGAMRRFLKRAKPLVAIVMETELWPNLFNQCRRRGIEVVLASARLSAKSVTRYRRFGALFRPVSCGGTFVAAQSTEDAERFLAIGSDPERTRVVGNVKFDVTIDPELRRHGQELRAAFGDRPVWIAGSTHPGEEDMVLTAHSAVLAGAPDALLVLVPRHPERFQTVADLLGRRGFRYERRSSSGGVGPAGSLPPDAQVFLIDTVGELAALYGAVDVAFVGGSLVPVGGHNLLEPAAFGVPVITGPHHANGREVAQLLLQSGAAIEVDNAMELAGAVGALLADARARAEAGEKACAVIAANRGSVDEVLDLVEPILSKGR